MSGGVKFGFFLFPSKWICVNFWYYWLCVGGGACS